MVQVQWYTLDGKVNNKEPNKQLLIYINEPLSGGTVDSGTRETVQRHRRSAGHDEWAKSRFRRRCRSLPIELHNQSIDLSIWCSRPLVHSLVTVCTSVPSEIIG